MPPMDTTDGFTNGSFERKGSFEREERQMSDRCTKVAAVTGANRGLGKATAIELAKAGYAVVVGTRFVEKASETLAEIERIGGQAVAVACDVTEYSQVERFVAAALDTFGRLDVLINNAGIIDPMTSVEESDPLEWELNIKTNLLGVYYGCRAALRHFLPAGGGIIVNVSSGAAHRPRLRWSAYCTGKAGVAMLTQCIALESGQKGIRVYGFQPAVVATDMQKQIRSRRVNEVSDLPADQLLDPAIPARAIVRLCELAPEDLNGQDLTIRDPELLRRLGLEGIMG